MTRSERRARREKRIGIWKARFASWGMEPEYIHVAACKRLEAGVCTCPTCQRNRKGEPSRQMLRIAAS